MSEGKRVKQPERATKQPVEEHQHRAHAESAGSAGRRVSAGVRVEEKKAPNAAGNNVVRYIAIVICALVFLGSAGYLAKYIYESFQNQRQAQSTVDQFVRPVDDAGLDSHIQPADTTEDDLLSGIPAPKFIVDFDSLKAVNDDVVAWIQISGLDNVNYPIVWSGDNDYYLYRSWDAQASRYGAIFMDELNATDFSDAYTLIYGHNMKDGSMFGGLKKYRDKAFYEENGGLITIYLPDRTCTYQIFSVRQVASDSTTAYTKGFVHDESFGEFVQYAANHSMYDTGVTVSANDKVICLSTCANDDRLVLFAKLTATVLKDEDRASVSVE